MKGYCILLPGPELAYDHLVGLPFFCKRRDAAERALVLMMPSGLRKYAQIVKVERDGTTYTVLL